MKENEIFKLKQELSEVKDLVQEVLRRFGELEFRGNLTYGDPITFQDTMLVLMLD